MSGRTPQVSEGDQLGDWVVGVPLGSGGMGAVFRCHNAFAPDLCGAIKVVHPDAEMRTRERFTREMASLAKLKHPALVRILSGGEAHDGELLYMVMELVEGVSLEDVLHAGGLPVQFACALFRELADGVAHAHRNNIAHRDIKPSNLMLAGDGTGRLLDFGIAVDDDATRLTQAGMVPGTVEYLPPEVFGGGAGAHYQSDIYALALVFHEMVIGERVFVTQGRRANAMLDLVRQKNEKLGLDPGPLVPGPLRKAIRRATGGDPAERPSAEELAGLFAAAAMELPTTPPDDVNAILRELMDATEDDPASDRAPAPVTVDPAIFASGDGAAPGLDPDDELTRLAGFTPGLAFRRADEEPAGAFAADPLLAAPAGREVVSGRSAAADRVSPRASRARARSGPRAVPAGPSPSGLALVAGGGLLLALVGLGAVALGLWFSG